VHTARHFIYASQFVIIANLRFHGAALLLLLLLYGVDVFIAWSDVWEEHDSRRIQGGLPRESTSCTSCSHCLSGVHALRCAGGVARPLSSNRVVVDPPAVPALLRLYMTGMGLGAFCFFVHDLAGWLRLRRARAAAPRAA